MAERKHSTRTRRKVQNELEDTGSSVGVVGKTLASTESTRNATKRIPAMTTSRTFGQKSSVVNADVQTFLTKCMSTERWNMYTKEEKREILISLPPTYRPGASVDSPTRISEEDHFQYSPLSQEFCRGDKFLKGAIARFKRDLADGYYEKAWLNKAKQAHQDRSEGKFDEFIKQHTAELFVEEDLEREESTGSTDDGSYGDVKSKTGRPKKAQKSC